ncbi:hypothetical protein RJ527_08685 [Thalassospiraceae bacterium LMO-SO8]|nr:hypothetical protein [Alphaproteobacteria bacterium LMO-S08]WND77806.1 hypothetical protein RJ527_08685 [Thalassospiraceae bacterium LMO-SO8]
MMTDDQSDDPPNSITFGPHEGRELELMLSGQKPLALFFDTLPESGVIPDKDFDAFVRSGAFVMDQRIVRPIDGKKNMPPTRVVLYAIPSEAWRIQEALAILEPVFALTRPPSEEDDVTLGRLLGYAEEDIANFLGQGHP